MTGLWPSDNGHGKHYSHPKALMTLTLEFDLPADLAWFRLPTAVAARLQALLERQDFGQALTVEERAEA